MLFSKEYILKSVLHVLCVPRVLIKQSNYILCVRKGHTHKKVNIFAGGNIYYTVTVSFLQSKTFERRKKRKWEKSWLKIYSFKDRLLLLWITIEVNLGWMIQEKWFWRESERKNGRESWKVGDFERNWAKRRILG